MRGASQTLSRLSVARVAFAAASIFATGCMLTTPAQAKSYAAESGLEMATPQTQPAGGLNGTSVAYAVPRNTPPNGVEVVLPQPLSPSDVAFYRRAMELQQEGAFAASDRMLARVSDNSLVGIVLARRYLSRNYITSRAELTAWWAKYASSPMAPAIYALMRHKFSPSDLPPAPQLALLPEQPLGFLGAARPAYVPDSDVWRRLFVRGLDAWKRGDMTTAQNAFSQTAAMRGISSDERATSEVWAARTALRLQEPARYLDWLHQASWNSGTFYGMLAAHLLGQTEAPSNVPPPLTEADTIAVDSFPDGHLAFELLQVGLVNEAQQALRGLWPQIKTTPGLAHAAMAVAMRAGLIDTAVALANDVPASNELAGVSLPMPVMRPQGGFSVNPALIYALTRTESGFDPDATSSVGARGLMQLMPCTARLMRKVNGISGAITNPSTNLAIGQAYLKYLADLPDIKGNLLAVLASYNAGPNAASAWYGNLTAASDPLLFIEDISNTQTRHFVMQVLADSWIYAEEIGIQPQSLNELAEGNFPTLGDFNLSPPTIETADAQ